MTARSPGTGLVIPVSLSLHRAVAYGESPSDRPMISFMISVEPA